MTTATPRAAERATTPSRRPGPSQWAADLALGVRLSVGGGASGWSRLALIAAGIGIGVAMLLVATTIPAVMGARNDRIADRQPEQFFAASEEAPAPTEQSILIDTVRSDFRDRSIEGLVIKAEGSDPVLPPGVSAPLTPGDLVVSPALAELMESEDTAALHGRWGGRVVGEIGPVGLAGPDDLHFYLGVDEISEDFAMRVTQFGSSGASSPDPIGVLMGAAGIVLLLMPVAIFVSTAVRFGGEARDRRLAALRLVGADTAMTRRIAAGETLAGAVLGLGIGALLFLALSRIAHRLVPPDLSFYPADFRPNAVLAALVVVLVPTAAVMVTMSAMQRVVVEPLGVVRHGAIRRRRLWWRLALLIGGVALISPLRSGTEAISANVAPIVAGLVALLIGMTALLPWLVEAAVRRLGAGPVAWQLAVRRLQLDSGTAVRSVSGVAIAVTAIIALHGMTSAWTSAIEEDGGAGNDTYADVYDASTDERWITELAQTPGVREVGALAWVRIESTQQDAAWNSMRVGECATLQIGSQIDECADGDVFVLAERGADVPEPGSEHLLGDAEPQRWTLPATTVVRTDTEFGITELLVTPGALAGIDVGLGSEPTGADLRVALDPSTPDALDHLRTAVSRIDPAAHVGSGSERMTAATQTVRQMLLVATGALLVVIGASMLVNIAEQLRERRKLLAVLLAFGTRRRTLGWSILYQVAIPMVLGLIMAVATGTGLAAVLQTATGAPVELDWFGIGATSGAATLVTLLTTAASLPLLWRLTRPGGLRSE